MCIKWKCLIFYYWKQVLYGEKYLHIFSLELVSDWGHLINKFEFSLFMKIQMLIPLWASSKLKKASNYNIYIHRKCEFKHVLYLTKFSKQFIQYMFCWSVQILLIQQYICAVLLIWKLKINFWILNSFFNIKSLMNKWWIQTNDISLLDSSFIWICRQLFNILNYVTRSHYYLYSIIIIQETSYVL